MISSISNKYLLPTWLHLYFFVNFAKTNGIYLADKFMMVHTGANGSIGIADYGASLAICMRRDVARHYVLWTAEIIQLAEDGANILIENGWIEQPPQAPDRNALSAMR